MIQKKKFKITEKDGYLFSKKSGDTNKIHLDERYSYNSIFGNKICFGAQILIKIIDILKIDLNKKSYFKISFNQPAYYNEPINLIIFKNKNIKLINLFQFEKFIGKLEFEEKYYIPEKKNRSLLAKPNLNFKRIHKNQNKIDILKNLLMRLSKYVGVYNPGANSLLTEIEVFYDEKFKNDKFKIFSKKFDNRFNILDNLIEYKNFKIFFKSLERPKFNFNQKYAYSSNIIKFVKKLDENVLILGSSQGLGLQLLNILKFNKRIKIFATYYKNKIKLKQRNIIKINLDVNKSLNKVIELIKKNEPIKIFYFISDKIYFNENLNPKLSKNYRKFFINIPLRIINEVRNRENILFFYPSTEFISSSKKSTYSKIKLEAEKKINIFRKKNNIKIVTHRFPAIYSRQSINLLDKKPIFFNNYLEKNSNLMKLIVNKI